MMYSFFCVIQPQNPIFGNFQLCYSKIEKRKKEGYKVSQLGKNFIFISQNISKKWGLKKSISVKNPFVLSRLPEYLKLY